jgi:hypothetical protein
MKYKAIHNEPLTQTVQHQKGAFVWNIKPYAATCYAQKTSS